MTNELCIHHLIEVQAELTPDAIAAPGRAPLTYSRLHLHIDDVAKTLNSMCVGRNDRVATVLPNGPEMAVAFLAVAASATCAPLNPAHRAVCSTTTRTFSTGQPSVVWRDISKPCCKVLSPSQTNKFPNCPYLQRQNVISF